jgi:tripartite-type tricarboxylate transporter receptor subunit TctC
MNNPLREIASAALVAGLAVFASAPAAAQYPERPVKLIVPFPAGGGADVITRQFGARLEKKIGQPIVVENVPGAAGAIAAQRIAAAAPDGYNLLIGGNAELLIKTLIETTSYDTFRDFTPIGLIGSGPMVVVGRTSLSAQTLAEVIALARAKPGAMTFGSGAQGTPMHLIGEAIKAKAGVDIRFVPYRGAPPTLADVMGGTIDLGIVTLAAALPLIESGRVRAYAVSSLDRAAFAPTIPAISETKELAGFSLDFWTAVFGPANLPKPVVDKLAAAMVEVLDDPELKAIMAKSAITLRKLVGDEFRAFVAADYDSAKKVIEVARIGKPK